MEDIADRSGKNKDFPDGEIKDCQHRILIGHSSRSAPDDEMSGELYKYKKIASHNLDRLI